MIATHIIGEDIAVKAKRIEMYHLREAWLEVLESDVEDVVVPAETRLEIIKLTGTYVLVHFYIPQENGDVIKYETEDSLIWELVHAVWLKPFEAELLDEITNNIMNTSILAREIDKNFMNSFNNLIMDDLKNSPASYVMGSVDENGVPQPLTNWIPVDPSEVPVNKWEWIKPTTEISQEDYIEWLSKLKIISPTLRAGDSELPKIEKVTVSITPFSEGLKGMLGGFEHPFYIEHKLPGGRPFVTQASRLDKTDWVIISVPSDSIIWIHQSWDFAIVKDDTGLMFWSTEILEDEYFREQKQKQKRK